MVILVQVLVVCRARMRCFSMQKPSVLSVWLTEDISTDAVVDRKYIHCIQVE